jgi:hypothetical protein
MQAGGGGMLDGMRNSGKNTGSENIAVHAAWPRATNGKTAEHDRF